MTTRIATRPQHADEYADVAEMFSTLKALPPGSPEYTRQRDVIVRRCLRLAHNVARRFDGHAENLEDLTQVARLGLVSAVIRFDPDKGSSFLAFAIPTMMGEVRQYFRDHGSSTHVTRRLRDRHDQIIKATADLTVTLGRAPNAAELAEYLGLAREDVVESLIAARAYGVSSVDAPVSRADGEPRMLADTRGDADTGFDHIAELETVRPLLAALSECEQTVLYLRFFAGLTQTHIARQIGVSQMQVSRILERTLTVLRAQS